MSDPTNGKGRRKPPAKRKRKRGGGRKKGSGRTFSPYFTTRNGRRVWARDYGYEAWPIGG